MAINYESVFIHFVVTCTLVAGAIGGFSLFISLDLSLLLPKWIPAMIFFLAPTTLSTLALASGLMKNPAKDPNSLHRQNTIFSILDQLHSVLTSVMATVVLAYIFPENILLFRMEQQWQSYFESRNPDPIRRIQDQFRCCGLRNTNDRAWPFKDHNFGEDTCQLQFGYQDSCLAPWSKMQRFSLWVVFTAAVLIWASKLAFIYFGAHPNSWMSKFSSSKESADYHRATSQLDLAEKGGDDVDDTRAALLPYHTRSACPNGWEES